MPSAGWQFFGAEDARRVGKNVALVSRQGNTNVSGDVTLELKIPGVFATGARFLLSVHAWFENPLEGDRIKNVRCFDKDNKLSNPSPKVIFSLIDPAAPVGQRGWRIPAADPIFRLFNTDALGRSKMRSEFYLQIIATRNAATAGEKFFANIEWGIKR